MANPHAQWPRHGNRQRSNQLFPALEATADLNRGEQRLMAEVMIDMVEGRGVPTLAMGRAIKIADIMANG